MDRNEREFSEGILFTDMYQLTMSQLYFRHGLHESRAQFDHFFRNYPDYGLHQAGFCINAGLEWLLDWIHEAHFSKSNVDFLRNQRGRNGERLFDEDFLTWLEKDFTFQSLDLRAIPEGRVVHPHVPLTVVTGPLAVAQILETALLNYLNFQTLVATKAARIRESAKAQIILEFGLRRAHERGANAGARAALIGGADYTSNVGISGVMHLPPKGTHAHSMIQTFIALGGSERDAFQAYADLYPDDCLLLVDTIDTLGSGVPNAIRVFETLRERGHKPIGIRLDSGDLAYLSIQAARQLNQAGFEEAIIVLSNNLDELVIWQIATQIREEAPRYGVDPEKLLARLTYGVGTRLITSSGDSSLGGVYKLVAIQKAGEWVPAIKLSETPQKTPNPGFKNVWRLYDRRGKATADLLALEDENPHTMAEIPLRNPLDHTKKRTVKKNQISQIEPLLVDILIDGKQVYELPDLEAMRKQRIDDVSCLDPGIQRLMNPHIYHVSLTKKLWDLKESLVREVKTFSGADSSQKQE